MSESCHKEGGPEPAEPWCLLKPGGGYVGPQDMGWVHKMFSSSLYMFKIFYNEKSKGAISTGKVKCSYSFLIVEFWALALLRSLGTKNIWPPGETDQSRLTSSYKMSHREEKYSMENTVNNIVITLFNDRCWLHSLCWALTNVWTCWINVLYIWN